ncbi:hypothetical protein Pcinc_036439 [Petrolisthes cinctipes]|uniref:Telomerase-binding protein EST1A n=1 Tax=Petrolisthes cinctipes TaxID=88211 RepID=A0AAE1EPI9_PETCI|nr:hypothetical protein Pcinc_036439 [Petrolisthes cinctipes]
MSSTGGDPAGTRDEPAGEDGERRDRVRKPKKPEIQLYRPGALRQKLSTGTNADDTQEQSRPDVANKPEKSRSSVKKSEKPKPDVNKVEKPRADVNKAEKSKADVNKSEQSRCNIDRLEKKPVVSRLFGEETRGYERNYNEKGRQSVEKEKQEGRQSSEKEKRGTGQIVEEKEDIKRQSVEKEKKDGRHSSEREKNMEKKRKNERNTVKDKACDYHDEGYGNEKKWPRDSEKRHPKKGRESPGTHFKEDFSRDRFIYPSKPRDYYELYSPGTSPTTRNLGSTDQCFDFSKQGSSFKTHAKKGSREKIGTKSPGIEIDYSNQSFDNRSSNWAQERKGNREKGGPKSPNVEVDKSKNVSQTNVAPNSHRYDTYRVVEEEEYESNTCREKTPSFRRNRQAQSDRKNPKGEKRKGGGKASVKDREMREQQVERSFNSSREEREQSDGSFNFSREGKELADRSYNSSGKKITQSHFKREKDHKDERYYNKEWVEDDISWERKQDGPKRDKNISFGAHEQVGKRSDGPSKISAKERTDEKRSAAQVYHHKEDQNKRGGGGVDAWPTKSSTKERSQDERVKFNKQYTENQDMHHPHRKPTGRGNNRKINVSEREQGMYSRSHSTLDPGYSSDGIGKEKEDGQMSVTELAAKVDQLTVGKPKGKTGGPKKKGKGWQETSGYGGDAAGNKKRYIHEGMTKGTWLEVQEGEQEVESEESPVSHAESPDKYSRGGDYTRRRDTQEHLEKLTRVKSYSGSRENRKKLGGNGKEGNQQQPPGGGKREEIKIDVMLNADGQERVVALARPRTDSESEEYGSGRGRTPSGREEDNLVSRNRKNVTPASHDSRNKLGSLEGVAWKTPGKKQSPGGWGNESDVSESPLRGMDDDKEDWGREVDRDLTWCNQDGSTRSPTWEDEKQSWRARRGKRQSESEDTHRRVESPGHRGGLIQMPVCMSRPDPPVTESTLSHSPSTPLPIPQKMLYNPNNPSKPVAVVPSARDLPMSRESPRDSGRGEAGGSGVSGVGTPLPAFVQSGQTSEYALEGHSPKIDPSIIYSIQKGELDINYYVSSNQLPVEFRRIMDIRHHLQGCYRQLLVSDIRLCQERNVEGSLWKTLYYVIIEKLREYITRDPSLKERSLSTLLMLVEEGQQYLQELLEALQREYGFTLEGSPEEDAPGTSSQGSLLRGRVRVAHVSAQKLLLSLGDLARYREQYNPTPNYTIAKKWYQMALQVHPRNGRPFNQLAIIAVNQKRPLDVVYFYVRSLTASNPFMSARDSLVSMFDDMRKKYLSQQSNENTSVDGASPGIRGKLHGAMPGGSDGRGGGGEGLRQELWIRPDSGATNKRTLAQPTQPEEEDQAEDEQLRKIPTDQLMKRFLTSYLHCHGMLFSRVGLDGFRECCTRMLREFRALLLSGSPTSATPGPVPSRLSTQHLLQIMAVNMYAVANTEVKGEC